MRVTINPVVVIFLMVSICSTALSMSSVDKQLLALAAGDSDNSAAMDKLLAQGANVNIADSNRNTPLYFAAQKNHITIASKLIALGANVNAQNLRDETPLLVATICNAKEIVRMLINANALVDLADDNVDTPLLLAAEYGREEIASMLIRAGANVNWINLMAVAPLYMAVINAHVGIVEKLVEAQASVNEPGDAGQSPLLQALEAAREAGEFQRSYEKIVALLIKSGADFSKYDEPSKQDSNELQIAKQRVNNQPRWDIRKNLLLIRSLRSELRLVQPME